MLVATEKREPERAVLGQLAVGIAAGRDRELAVRMMLVEFILTDAVEIKLLTKDRVNGPSSLVLIDGEPPRPPTAGDHGRSAVQRGLPRRRLRARRLRDR